MLPVLLEVIVQSVADACAAATGGADRLEVVRAIDRGGLTPPLGIVRAIAAETGLPLRVMVRETDGFTVADAGELAALQRAVDALASLGVDGVVLGFARAGQVDLPTLHRILSAAPGLHATFHRVFDALDDPAAAIDLLRSVGGIDRILTDGGGGSWQDRCRRWRDYAERAGSGLTILAGAGLDAEAIAAIARAGCVQEVHVGRAARDPAMATAPVSAARVRRLKERAAPPMS